MCSAEKWSSPNWFEGWADTELSTPITYKLHDLSFLFWKILLFSDIYVLIIWTCPGLFLDSFSFPLYIVRLQLINLQW